jgi:RHS repeat-associated protein
MVGYVYDANGARVAKGAINAWSCDPSVNGFTTTSDYVLDTSGAQVTEMSVSGGASTWSHTNVWGSGKLLATYDMTGKGMHYYLDDPLGSRRVQTDYAGVVEQTCSSLPFGDALSCTGSKTTPTEHHYTGKERDAESGNDYFGARYYASSMGRMLSPDPSQLVYADQMNPQSLNLYSYVLNNPLINTDPTGMECVWDDGSYDSNDDPDTGSTKKCEGGSMGGHWVDHSFFQNANDNGANLPDWSSKPNSSIDLNSPLGLVTLLATCTDTILDAINAQFAQTGLDMTTDNVTDNFYYHGAVNIDISATNLSSGQYNSIHAGRYRNPNGSDSSPSLHLPKGPGGSDSPQTIPFSNPKNGTISATAHIDSALAGLFHPSGTLQHYKTDVQGSGANRSPCPSGDQK